MKSKSGLPFGVTKVGKGKFRACIRIKNRRLHLGHHDTAEQAAIYVELAELAGIAFTKGGAR